MKESFDKVNNDSLRRTQSRYENWQAYWVSAIQQAIERAYVERAEFFE